MNCYFHMIRLFARFESVFQIPHFKSQTCRASLTRLNKVDKCFLLVTLRLVWFWDPKGTCDNILLLRYSKGKNNSYIIKNMDLKN